MVYLMLPGGSRTIPIVYLAHASGLVLYSTCTDPAQHLVTAAVGYV